MDEISHIGVVKEIKKNGLIVEIISKSACGTCNAAGVCSASEVMKKNIYIPHYAVDDKYKEGDQVEVLLKKQMGIKAVVLAYILPIIIMMFLVLSLSYAGINELLTGLIIIGGVAVYYTILYFFRRSLSREYVFGIRRK